MEFRQSFVVLILVALSASSVTSVQITVTPASLWLYKGQTLAIRCQETITAADASLLQLGLYKDVRPPGTAVEDFQSVREYSYVVSNGGAYVGKWGPAATGDLPTRLNITETFTDPSHKSGSVEFVLPNVKCEDAAAFKCRSTSDVVAFSETRNISVVGVTKLTDLTGAQECDSYNPDSQTCDNCVNFDDPNGPKPKYAAMNADLMLTCTADVDSSITQNAFKWYKKTISDNLQQQIIENITDNSNPPTPGSCTYVGRSTLRYFPRSADRELRVYCEVGNNQVMESRELSICVQGLTSTPPKNAALGGGPFDGIVIGVIAAISCVIYQVNSSM